VGIDLFLTYNLTTKIPFKSERMNVKTSQVRIDLHPLGISSNLALAAQTVEVVVEGIDGEALKNVQAKPEGFRISLDEDVGGKRGCLELKWN
jgi:hypothetical protein